MSFLPGTHVWPSYLGSWTAAPGEPRTQLPACTTNLCEMSLAGGSPDTSCSQIPIMWPSLGSLKFLPNALLFSLKNLIPFLKSSVVPQANTTFPCFLNKTGYWFITSLVWQQINTPGSSLSDDPKIAEQLFSWRKWTPGLPVWELWMIPSSQPFFCSKAKKKAGLVITHITFPALPFP